MSNSNFPHTEDFRAKEKELDNDIKHVEAQSVTQRTNHQETQQRPTKVVAQWRNERIILVTPQRSQVLMLFISI